MIWHKEKGKGDSEEEKQKAQHRAFPRGPPPQYYPGSNCLTSLFGWEAVSQADMAALTIILFSSALYG
eukprot:scaffold125543_cov36-Phaeocystis_antarctica.AAC.1